MNKEKALTYDQVDVAARALQFFKNLPDEKRDATLAVANAFIAGMEAQARINAQRDWKGDRQ